METYSNSLSLNIKNLIIKRKNFSVKIPELKLTGDKVIALIGPNGSGKTTLMLALAGLPKKESGSVELCENDIVKYKSPALNYRRNATMTFESPLLFNTSVENNLSIALKLKKNDKNNIKQIIDNELKRFKIDHLKSRNALTLSSGESQRVSLARAFSIKPKLLLMDEPFSSLDVSIKNELIEDLGKIISQDENKNRIIIFSTHLRDEALKLADYILIMNDGIIINKGDVEEIQNAKDNFTKNFIGEDTILIGKVYKSQAQSTYIKLIKNENIEFEIPGEYPLNTKITFTIRPEDVVLLKNPKTENEMSIRNNFKLKIINIEEKKYTFLIHLNDNFSLKASITKQSYESMGLKLNDYIYASIKATAINVIRSVSVPVFSR